MNIVCPKCNGTGKFKGYTGRIIGDCFKCKGTGSIEQAKEKTSGQRSTERSDQNIYNDPRSNPPVFQSPNPIVGHFPKIIDLILNKKVKLNIGPAKIVMFLDGRIALVAPVFGQGIYGYFDKSNGAFKPNKKCTDEMIIRLQDVESRGLAAVKEISALLGHCCMCGRTLVNEDSINAGIGPICAGKMEGW